MPQLKTILEMHNISKEYPGVKALEEVNFSIAEGEVHALCGENGAGKSTLMKILSGAIPQTSGEILLKGQTVDFSSTRDAVHAGISMVYQEFNLINDLSVAENIFINRLPKKGLFINWEQLHKDAESILKKLNFNIDPDALIRELSVAEAQMVEIAKCVSMDANIIIMDEPTAALTDEEIETLFNLIEDLKQQNITIIYISHRMDEIFKISDRITVLRNGKYIGTRSIKETNYDDVVSMMIGRYVDSLYPVRDYLSDEHVFEVRGLTGKIIQDVGFKLHKGEILGVVGLLGSGNYELTKLIYGSASKKTGQFFYEGHELEIHSPKDAIKAGIGLIPEDRKREGLVLIQSVKDNMVLSSLKNISNNGIINGAKEKAIVTEEINNLNIKVSDPKNQLVNNLSGGNQQKVLFAKTFMTQPNIFMFNEPTRGVDVGAKAEIYRIIDDLTGTGISVILVSSDLEEVIGMCDRILVLRAGKIVLDKMENQTSQEELLAYASGGVVNE